MKVMWTRVPISGGNNSFIVFYLLASSNYVLTYYVLKVRGHFLHKKSVCASRIVEESYIIIAHRLHVWLAAGAGTRTRINWTALGAKC